MATLARAACETSPKVVYILREPALFRRGSRGRLRFHKLNKTRHRHIVPGDRRTVNCDGEFQNHPQLPTISTKANTAPVSTDRVTCCLGSVQCPGNHTRPAWVYRAGGPASPRSSRSSSYRWRRTSPTWHPCSRGHNRTCPFALTARLLIPPSPRRREMP